MSILPVKKESQPGNLDINRILRVNVPVIVKLAERKINLKEVLQLGNGSIIEFFKSSGNELDLLVNNKIIATGVAVKVGENFGLRLNHVGEVRDRLIAICSDTDRYVCGSNDHRDA